MDAKLSLLLELDKCAVCDDFDFCEECEKKKGEEHNHPFLKIYEPKMTPISFKCFGQK